MNRDQARTILTPKQFEAWDLNTRGMGYKAIAIERNISVSTARSLVLAARLNLAKHQENAA